MSALLSLVEILFVCPLAYLEISKTTVRVSQNFLYM